MAKARENKKCSSQKCVTEVIQLSSKLLNHCFGVRIFSVLIEKEKRNAIFFHQCLSLRFGWAVLHIKTNASTLNEYLFISPLSLSLPSSLFFFVSSVLNYLCDIFKASQLRVFGVAAIVSITPPIRIVCLLRGAASVLWQIYLYFFFSHKKRRFIQILIVWNILAVCFLYGTNTNAHRLRKARQSNAWISRILCTVWNTTNPREGKVKNKTHNSVLFCSCIYFHFATTRIIYTCSYYWNWVRAIEMARSQ